jgi:hypothetical protein
MGMAIRPTAITIQLFIFAFAPHGIDQIV